MNRPTTIEHIGIYKLNIERSLPTQTSLGVLQSAQNIAIKITANNNEFGWGEASPYAPITGDSQESNFVTAQQLAQLIKGKDPLAIEARMAEINNVTVGQPSIRSAFDMALYDLAAKTANMPLYQFLGGELSANGKPKEMRTDLTIGMQDSVEGTVEQARQILAAGFNAIKMKVGRSSLEDVAHVKAVRELVGPDIAIRIDSNQGWDYPTAVANLHAMKSLNLQYSEQPLAYWDYINLARLRDNFDLPICADESVFDDKDALKVIKSGAADYINIKLGKSGGIRTALKINAIAEAAGCKCMIGCFSESRLALTAAAHLAMACPNIVFLDLDSAYKQKDDPVLGGMTYDDQIGGLLYLPETPGIGAEFTENHYDQNSRLFV